MTAPPPLANHAALVRPIFVPAWLDRVISVAPGFYVFLIGTVTESG